MRYGSGMILAGFVSCLMLVAPVDVAGAQSLTAAELDRLEAEIVRAEDVSAIKRLQRAYGYYLDKGLWADLADLFTDDAVVSLPDGVFEGRSSLEAHLYLNAGRGDMGEIGLDDGRLYDHLTIQPVVHLDPGGQSANGRWRGFVMLGEYGSSATWAEGVYEVVYVKEDAVWKIQTLDYYPGFVAPYATGWVNPGEQADTGPVELVYPPDRRLESACTGFPDACMAPFHYDNPGTSADGAIWRDEGAGEVAGAGVSAERVSALALRARRLAAETEIENLQRIYGFYVDHGYWDEAARLFTADGTLELGLQGVYRGPDRIEEFLALQGPYGAEDGWLNDRVQLQIVVSVSEDGMTARARSRELSMTGVYDSHGEWGSGIYENTYVNDAGIWKFQSMRFYPTFVSPYADGWGVRVLPLAGVSEDLPPDAPPTEIYATYPAAHIPPFHFVNPVTGRDPQYPVGAGRPSRAALQAIRADVPYPGAQPDNAPTVDGRSGDSLSLMVAEEAARRVARFKDYHEIENLESAYGYYLDKNLWNDLADLFAEDSAMELAQRGLYSGPGRVRAFLLNVFGRGGEGPVAGQLGNHIQWQPVIHVDADGQTARIRSRMFQQMTRGERASMGASIYENLAIREDGRWKFSEVHTFNTWGAGYDTGWPEGASTFVPGPSADFPPDAPPTLVFQMWPTVYTIPFHYRNPADGSGAPPSGQP